MRPVTVGDRSQMPSPMRMITRPTATDAADATARLRPRSCRSGGVVGEAIADHATSRARTGQYAVAVSTVQRLRFAPSPTGYLHLGSARAALFNWLHARHLATQGIEAEFLIRIEDTDHERSRPELIQVIFDVMEWLGIDYDGEPTFQSGHRQVHIDAIAKLVASGAAYRCSCTQDEVKARNEAAGGTPGYDGFCRDRDVAESEPHVVRFRSPDDGETSWDDLIRGTITVEHRTLEDFVLARTDGTPVFLVANAVDDAEMGITHVIRGEDLINVTPKVLLIREALGYEGRPLFGHMPLIVNDKRKKLSKRRDDVSVEDYKTRGFLPEAMVNYLALLGWGPADGVEVRPVGEIIELFDIADVGSAPAMFDLRKLEAINGDHIRMLAVDEFIARCAPFLGAQEWSGRVVAEQFAALAPEVQTRVKVLSEVPAMVDFLFVEQVAIDEAAWTKAVGGLESPAQWLDAVIDRYESTEAWTAEALHDSMLSMAEERGHKLGKAQAPVRVAVTGRSVGPPLFESLVILGRDETIRRVRAARGRL